MTSDGRTHSSVDAGGADSRDGFEIEVQRPAPGVILLRLQGEIDMWASLPLMERIIEAFHEHPALIAVDLSDVGFMDTAGLGVLVEGQRHIEDGRVRFAVICPSDHRVMRFLQLAGQEGALSIHESAADALGPWLDGKAGEVPAGA